MRAQATPIEPRTSWRTWLTGVFFMLCLTCSYLDKQVISILVEPIRADLKVSDLQIGLLQGFTFSLCHAFMGIPLARLLDRGDRPRITTACIILWSAATTSCAFAFNFAWLLVGRALTAMGEAGLIPASLSLIRDIFPRNRVAAGTTIFMIGSYLGMGLALLGGGPLFGWLAERGGLTLPGLGHVAPWRAVFLFVGLPGLLFAAVMWLCVPEPRRRDHGASLAFFPAPSFGTIFGANPRFFVGHWLGVTLGCMSMYANMAWLPTVFIRVHHLSPAATGAMIGPVYVLAGLTGAGLAVALARTTGDPLRRLFTLLAAASASLIVTGTAAPLVASPILALALFGLSTIASSMIVVLMPTPLQLAVPAAAVARVIVGMNISLAVGAAGLAPFLVGFLTDRFFQDPLAVGQSVAITCASSAVLALGVLRWTARRLPTTE